MGEGFYMRFLAIVAGLGLAGWAGWKYLRSSASPLFPDKSVPLPSPPVLPAAQQILGRGLWDGMIENVARNEGIPPHVLKAIVATESSFDPTAINPEVAFTLGGVAYSAADKTGRARLREYIMQGNNPSSVGLNPSIGLAQMRISTARNLGFSGAPAALFAPFTNLTWSARLLRQLFDAGITLETMDAYNVGQDLRPRNLLYRDTVKQFAERYEGDF